MNRETGLSMVDRIQYLEAFDLAGAGTDLGAIYNAFIACLTPMEACQLLSTTFTKPGRMRQILVREVQRHMRQDLQPYHCELLVSLEQGTAHLPPNNRRSAAYVLLRLSECLGANREGDILARVCQSNSAAIRSQVYRRVKQLPEMACPNFVLAGLHSHRDLEAARIVVTRGSEDIVVENFELLEKLLAQNGYLLTRLFLRLRGRAPADLPRLKDLDPIAHAYVCAKLGVILPPEELVSLFRASMFVGRAGLVAWCCGQMGHWDALVEIRRLREDPPHDVLDRLYRQPQPYSGAEADISSIPDGK